MRAKGLVILSAALVLVWLTGCATTADRTQTLQDVAPGDSYLEG